VIFQESRENWNHQAKTHGQSFLSNLSLKQDTQQTPLVKKRGRSWVEGGSEKPFNCFYCSHRFRYDARHPFSYLVFNWLFDCYCVRGPVETKKLNLIGKRSTPKAKISRIYPPRVTNYVRHAKLLHFPIFSHPYYIFIFLHLQAFIFTHINLPSFTVIDRHLPSITFIKPHIPSSSFNNVHFER